MLVPEVVAHAEPATVRLQNNASCVGLTVKADDLDNALLATIEAEVLTPERIRAMVAETFHRMMEDAGGELRRRRETLEGLILQVSGESQKITRAIGAGVLAMEDAREQTDPLRKRREEYRAELA